jgi:hypothetical protein
MSDQNGQSRAGLLKRAGLAIAGVAGVAAGGLGARELVRADPDRDALVLHGRNWRLDGGDRRPGERIRPGDRGTVYGDLVELPSGRRVGTFFGTRSAVDSNGGLVADGSLELHTFRLEGGTLLGMGSTIGGESIFSIVGGTGAYAGARGAYSGRQGLRELGGDGTAEFTLTLTA